MDCVAEIMQSQIVTSAGSAAQYHIQALTPLGMYAMWGCPYTQGARYCMYLTQLHNFRVTLTFRSSPSSSKPPEIRLVCNCNKMQEETIHKERRFKPLRSMDGRK